MTVDVYAIFGKKMKKLTTEEFINRANIVHHGFYDYSMTEYINKRTKVKIICPIHGEFEQLPLHHTRGQGCPICGKEYAMAYSKNAYDYQSFIDESRNRFGDIYEYPNIENEYSNSHSKIHFKCKKCGNVFTKIACDHLTSPHGGCLLCYSNKSKCEEEIGEFIQGLFGDDVILRGRDILDRYELDIYIPSLKIGIEYNGLYWHREEKKGKYYHLNKLQMCNQKGIKLIQIFEDEYIHHKDIVLNKLCHLLCKNKQPSIMARKCTVTETDSKTAKEFLNKHHIQGFANGTIHLSCIYNDQIVGIMSFKKENKNSNDWELVRFATDNSYRCNGAGGKLFKYFIRKYNPAKIKSFADRRWTINEENNLYIQLGFDLCGYTPPDYRYVEPHNAQRMHKFGFRKKILHKKYGFPLSMTENEMTKELKLYKIYDCGLIKYIWKNKLF